MPEFNATAPAEKTPIPAAFDANVVSAQTFTELHVTKESITTTVLDAWSTGSGVDWHTLLINLNIARAEVMVPESYSGVFISAPLYKYQQLRIGTPETVYALTDTSGNWTADTNIDESLYAEYDCWQEGDTIHYDATAGRIWVTDANSDIVTLRIAYDPSDSDSFERFAPSWALLKYVGWSAWDNSGAWEWADQGVEYVPGGEVVGEDQRGILYPQDVANLNRFPAAPGTNGTYTLTCTVANGTVTYSWD
jgi:hypothetical protein